MLAEYSHYRLIQVQENWTRPAMIRTWASQHAHTKNQTCYKQNFVMIIYLHCLCLQA